jgi:transposase
MAWREAHRRAADRRGLRFPSDLTEGEWALVAPLLPPPRRAGRPRRVDLREALNAIFYVLSTGCQWAALPRCFPPKSTVFDHFQRLAESGALERIHDALFEAERARRGRARQPSLGVVDAQAVAGAPKGGRRSTARGSMRANACAAASGTSSSMPTGC